MLSRRICTSTVAAYRAANIAKGQSRLLNVSVPALQNVRPDLHTKDQNDLNNIKRNHPGSGAPGAPMGGAGGMNMMYVLAGVAALGGGYWIYKSKFAQEKVEEGKNKVAGKYMAHKAGKEFEKYKEIVVNIAKELGGKDLADKVSKMIDESKDTIMKMAEHFPEAKDKLEKVAGAVGVGGIGKYISEFEKAKDLLVSEAKKMGGDDVAKKAGKVYDDAKDKIQTMLKNVREHGIEKSAKEYDNVKDYIVKEIKKIGGDDLSKKAAKMFDEAKDKLQKLAADVDEGNIISDSQYQMAKDFVVKEAEKLGGRDLAKKAAKLMDEAKEKVQSVAHEVKKQ